MNADYERSFGCLEDFEFTKSYVEGAWFQTSIWLAYDDYIKTAAESGL